MPNFWKHQQKEYTLFILQKQPVVIKVNEITGNETMEHKKAQNNG